MAINDNQWQSHAIMGTTLIGSPRWRPSCSGDEVPPPAALTFPL